MLRMRRRRIVGAAVGTAVVVGTAGAVRHHQDQKYAEQDAAGSSSKIKPISRAWLTPRRSNSSRAASGANAPARARRAAAGPDLTAQLQQLAQLHTAGVLSDEEFAAAKQKLLAG